MSPVQGTDTGDPDGLPGQEGCRPPDSLPGPLPAGFIPSEKDVYPIMATKEVFHGVPGILRPFKEYLTKSGLAKGDQVVYYGVPGTCTPFVELLAFAVRSMELDQVFVPFVDEGKAKKVVLVDGVGMQARDPAGPLSPKAVVVMGGLSMPDVPVEAAQIKAAIDRHPGVKVIGVCFMHMFEKAGWLPVVPFDCLIDANIDPVEVEKQG